MSEILIAAKAGGIGKLDSALDFLMEKLHKRSVVMVISDFLSPRESLVQMAKVMKANHHEVYWIQVLDPAEVDFPFQEWAQFRGLEGEEDLSLHAREASRGYLRELKIWQADMKDIAAESGIQFMHVRTDEPLAHVLTSIF